MDEVRELIQLQTDLDPKLILMANSLDNRGRSHKSYTINFPASDHNNELINFAFGKQYNKTLRFEAVLKLDGMEFMGDLLINNLNKDRGQAVFVSGNGTLWGLLEGKELSDIDLSSFDLSSFAKSDIDYVSGDFVAFVLADYGEFMEVDKIDITEHLPAVNVKQLIDKIFNSVGVGVTWDVSPIYESEINNTYELYNKTTDIRNSNEWLRDSGFRCDTEVGAAQQTFNSVGMCKVSGVIQLLTTNENYTPINGRLTIPESGTYFLNIIYNFQVTISGDTNNVPEDTTYGNIIIKKNGGEYRRARHKLATLGGSVSGVLVMPPSELQANDYLTFHFEGETEYLAFSGITVFTSIQAGTDVFTFGGSRWYGAGSTIEIKDILPKKKVLDWFRDIFKTLNIDVFYQKETNQVKLIHRAFEKPAVARLEVWDYEEDLDETVNYELEYNTDKAIPPANDLLDFQGVKTEGVKFNYSRTYFQNCFRLIGEEIPTLWESGDPRKFDAEIPKRKTESNPRLLTVRGVNATDYNLTFGGGLDAAETTDGAAVALWQELKIKEYWATVLAKENTEVKFKAKLTPLQVLNFYNQNYFSAPIEIYNGDWSLGLVQVLEATQMGGAIFTFKARRV